MRAKCRTCGKTIDTKTAYRVIHTTKGGVSSNRYYCNIEHYEHQVKEEIARSNLVHLLNELLEISFNDGGTFFNKKLSEIYPTYTYQEIYRVADEISLDLQFALEGLKSNGHKINYLFAVLKNKLYTYGDEEPQFVKDEREVIKVDEIKFDEPVMPMPKKTVEKPVKKQAEDVDFEIDF